MLCCWGTPLTHQQPLHIYRLYQEIQFELVFRLTAINLACNIRHAHLIAKYKEGIYTVTKQEFGTEQEIL